MQTIEGGGAHGASPGRRRGPDDESVATRLGLVLTELDDAYVHLEGALAALRDLRVALRQLHHEIDAGAANRSVDLGNGETRSGGQAPGGD